MGLKKRGQFFEIDAIIAIAIFIFGLIFIRSMYLNPSQVSNLEKYSTDAVDYLKNTKIKDLPVSVRDQLALSFLSPENSLAKQISIYMIKRDMIGAAAADDSINAILSYLDETIPGNIQYCLEFDTLEHPLGCSGSAGIGQARDVSTSKTMITGLHQDKYVEGKLASIRLVSAIGLKTKYMFFGGFTGQGDLTYPVFIPSDAVLENFYIEGFFGGEADIVINGVDCISLIDPDEDPGFYKSAAIDTCLTNLLLGQDNLIKIRFLVAEPYENRYVGGGFLRIKYYTESE